MGHRPQTVFAHPLRHGGHLPGRMGKGAEIYLASPATVVASAIAGCIANPGDYL